MYRGSRLAASFLLFLTGSAATVIGFGVAPSAVGTAWPLAGLAVAFGIAHSSPSSASLEPVSGAGRWP